MLGELRYRVAVFRKPRGPWRERRADAQRDAFHQGLGSFDEYGRFFITVPADIEARSEDQIGR